MSDVDRPTDPPIALRRFSSSAWATTGVSALLALAARTTGAGWLVVILCLLAGALVVGIVWPRLSLARLRLRATGPRDATAGRDETVEVRVTPARMGLLIRTGADGWRGVVGDGPATTAIRPTRRGRLTHIDVELACGAPFGMSWARRHRRVPLDREMLVAPRTAALDIKLPTGVEEAGDEYREARRRGGERMRSVRDYMPGDPLRHVHWPVTARRGELTVKEFETPGRPHLHISVELSGDADADERTCERAMAAVAAALARDFRVSLGTAAPHGPDLAMIGTTRDAGRRLAVACPGRCPGPADPWHEHLRLRSGGR